ncbi:MAG: aldo/keto reductase [Verrucomicrobiales bacterium]
MSSSPLRWGILGTGNIAHKFAIALQSSHQCRLVAVGSRGLESAQKFASAFGSVTPHASYEALLEDPEVQAVYVSTPHPLHAEWGIKTLNAGKHLLCEKPLTMNYSEATAMVHAAQHQKLVLMEAFMYRCHPQTQKIVDLIRTGAIGMVQMIDATFSFAAHFSPESRLFSRELGGGGILDVGCYPMSMSRLLAGAALGKPFEEPLELKAVSVMSDETGVDLYSTACAKFPGDILANLTCGVGCRAPSHLTVLGTKGSLHVPQPWIPSRDGGPTQMILRRYEDPQPEFITVETLENVYAIEADQFAEAVFAGKSEVAAMSPDDTLGNMLALDRWRREIKLAYPGEVVSKDLVPAKLPVPWDGVPQIPRKAFPGLDKKVSTLVMGSVFDHSIILKPQAVALFDGFMDLGGNTFDLAYIYRSGQCEKILGQWLKSRQVRDDVVILAKGAATPNCDPEGLTKQLLISLDRIGVDHAEIYVMHRDNLDVPVGEFVEVLNEHVQAGRIGVFGGSNWTIRRIQEANAYAQAKGLQGFSLLSNNFSLAQMVHPVWEGCVAASDPESKAWLIEQQFPLFAWSSLARGFFVQTEDQAQEKQDESWFSTDNVERLSRARQLADRLGVNATEIALAFALHQAFPLFALVGPHTHQELAGLAKASALELAPEHIAWLDLASANRPW